MSSIGASGKMEKGDGIVHPVDRINARWICIKCNKVDSKYEEERCLVRRFSLSVEVSGGAEHALSCQTFAGVCAHECPTDSAKKKARRTWQATQFTSAPKVGSLVDLLISHYASLAHFFEQAIAVINAALDLCGIDPKMKDSLSDVNNISSFFRCGACPGFIAMDFQHLVRCFFLSGCTI
jgi:hypothetical protein